MKAAVRFFAQGISSLDQKAWNDAVKSRAIIKLYLGKIDKIFDMSRRSICQESDLNLPQLRRDRRLGILFSKLQVG